MFPSLFSLHHHFSLASFIVIFLWFYPFSFCPSSLLLHLTFLFFIIIFLFPLIRFQFPLSLFCPSTFYNYVSFFFFFLLSSSIFILFILFPASSSYFSVGIHLSSIFLSSLSFPSILYFIFISSYHSHFYHALSYLLSISSLI